MIVLWGRAAGLGIDSALGAKSVGVKSWIRISEVAKRISTGDLSADASTFGPFAFLRNRRRMLERAQRPASTGVFGVRVGSFAPPGLVEGCIWSPRLAPWAAFCRRFAAGVFSASWLGLSGGWGYPTLSRGKRDGKRASMDIGEPGNRDDHSFSGVEKNEASQSELQDDELQKGELQEEARRIRRLQVLISMVSSVISQDPNLTVEEASELAAGAKRAALAMFPDKELAYDLLYKPRLQRLMTERFRLQ